MLIRNYGLFWHADRVGWGKPNNAGTLEGYRAGAKKMGQVNFRDQKGIYVLFDETYRIVYVGQAGGKNQCLFGRLKQHRVDMLAERWSRFSWFGTRNVKEDFTLETSDKKFDTDLGDVLNHLEGILIAACEPPLNRQGPKFGNAVRYLQSIEKAK